MDIINKSNNKMPSYEGVDSGFLICADIEMLPFININPGQIKSIPTGISVNVIERHKCDIDIHKDLSKIGCVSLNSSIHPGDIDFIRIIVQNISPKPVKIYHGDKIALISICRVKISSLSTVK